MAQGSNLGPLMFLFYINDMVNSTTELNFIQYADDTTVLFSSLAVNFVTPLNSKLNQVQNWILANRLSLNLNKSYYMVFGSNINLDASVKIGNTSITSVSSIKFLGMTIDRL